MLPMMFRRSVLLMMCAVSAVSAISCGVYDRAPCGEFRTVQASADVGGAGPSRLGYVSLNFSEERDTASTAQPPEITLIGYGPDTTTGGPLKGHIAKVRVLSAAGDELYVPPLASSVAPIVVFWSDVVEQDRTKFESVRDLLIGGQLRIEITTDESPARVFLLNPTVTKATDWQQVYCL